MVYLAQRNFGTAINTFTEKKIAHLAPGRVSDSPIRVLAPDFTYPTNWFKFVLHTILTNTVTEFKTGFTFNLFKTVPGGLTYEVPVCSFRFRGLTDAQRNDLLSLGMQPDPSNPNIYVGSPSHKELAKITSLGPIGDRIRPGHIDYDGYLAWTFLLRGVQAFCVLRNSFNGAINMAYELKKSVKFDKDGELATLTGGTYTGKAPSGKRAIGVTSDYFVGPDKAVDFSIFGASTVEQLGDMSNETGIFFEYFYGMNTPDKDICGRVFDSFFSGCCGSTMETDIEIMSRIKKGARSMAFSRTGMALSHIYRCMELSTQVSGAKIVPLVRGYEYVGTLIIGKDFSIHQYGEIYPAKAVEEQLASIDIMGSKTKKIAALLNSVHDEDMEMGENTRVVHKASDFLHSRRALEIVHGLDAGLYASTDIIKEVIEILITLPYGDNYVLPTVQNLLIFLKASTTGNFSDLQDMPAFLSKATLTKDRGNIPKALSMFGPRCPSCQVLGRKGTRTFNLVDNHKVDPNLVMKDGRRSLAYLPLWVESYTIAEKSWMAFLSNGQLAIPTGRPGKAEFTDTRNVSIQISGKEFNEVYAAMRDLCGSKVKKTPVDRKRKREDAEEQTGRAKLSKKVADEF